MSLPDYFVSTSVKITSTTSLGVTGRKEKGFGLDLVLIFFVLGWILYLSTILLTGSGSFKESDESVVWIIPGIMLWIENEY